MWGEMNVIKRRKPRERRVIKRHVNPKPAEALDPRQGGDPDGIVIPRCFRQDCFDVIFKFIRNGDSIADACKQPKMPSPRVVMTYLERDPKLINRFFEAVKLHLVSEIPKLTNILDGKTDGAKDDVSRARLMFEGRLKLLDRLMPDRFKKKIELEVGVTGELASVIRESQQQKKKLPPRPPGRAFQTEDFVPGVVRRIEEDEPV